MTMTLAISVVVKVEGVIADTPTVGRGTSPGRRGCDVRPANAAIQMLMCAGGRGLNIIRGKQK